MLSNLQAGIKSMVVLGVLRGYSLMYPDLNDTAIAFTPEELTDLCTNDGAEEASYATFGQK